MIVSIVKASLSLIQCDQHCNLHTHAPLQHTKNGHRAFHVSIEPCNNLPWAKRDLLGSDVALCSQRPSQHTTCRCADTEFPKTLHTILLKQGPGNPLRPPRKGEQVFSTPVTYAYSAFTAGALEPVLGWGTWAPHSLRYMPSPLPDSQLKLKDSEEMDSSL